MSGFYRLWDGKEELAMLCYEDLMEDNSDK